MSRTVPVTVGNQNLAITQQATCLTGESKIDPPQLILKMNKLPICFMISLRGIYGGRSVDNVQSSNRVRTPIFPVSDNDLGKSFV